jgi:hypothetical protein
MVPATTGALIMIQIIASEEDMIPIFQLCFRCIGERTGPDGGACQRCHGTGLDPNL